MKAKTKTYIELKESGVVASVKEAIVRELSKKPMTIKQLCNKLDLKWKTASARVSELMDSGEAKITGIKENYVSADESIFELTKDKEKEHLQNERLKDRLKRAKKLLRENGFRVLKPY